MTTTKPRLARYSEPDAATLRSLLPQPPHEWRWESSVTRTSRNDLVFSFTLATADHDAVTAHINVTRHGCSIISERARHLICMHTPRKDQP